MDEPLHSRRDDHLVEPLFGGLGHGPAAEAEQPPAAPRDGAAPVPRWLRWWRALTGRRAPRSGGSV